VPAVAAVPVVVPAVPAMVPDVVVVTVLAPERPLRLVDGRADRRADLLSARPGLGPGGVRRRRDRLAHGRRRVAVVPVVAAMSAVLPMAGVAAPIPIAPSAPSFGMTVPIAVATTAIGAIPSAPIPIAPSAAVLARVGPAFSAATSSTTLAAGVGDLVID
jgi:hypothetical protein